MSNNFKVLLLQAREPVMKEHEQKCFLRDLRLEPEQLDSFDILNQEISKDIVKDYQAIIIGGSGLYNLVNDRDRLHWLEPIKEVVQYCYDINKPMFGSCLGYQIILEAMGGTLVCDKKLEEIGTCKVYMTEHGQQDKVFEGLPKEFMAQVGHQDSAVTYPKDAIELAYSDVLRYHAFTFPGKKIYATQFHPELNKHDVLTRLHHYQEKYVGDADGLKRVEQMLVDSPYADKMLDNFMRLVKEDNK